MCRLCLCWPIWVSHVSPLPLLARLGFPCAASASVGPFGFPMCRLCIGLPLWVSHVSPLPVFSPFGFCVSSRIAAILAQAFGHLILEAGALRAPFLCSIFAILLGLGHGASKVVTEEAWGCRA